jgi:hypothetical protein
MYKDFIELASQNNPKSEFATVSSSPEKYSMDSYKKKTFPDIIGSNFLKINFLQTFLSNQVISLFRYPLCFTLTSVGS